MIYVTNYAVLGTYYGRSAVHFHTLRWVPTIISSSMDERFQFRVNKTNCKAGPLANTIWLLILRAFFAKHLDDCLVHDLLPDAFVGVLNRG